MKSMKSAVALIAAVGLAALLAGCFNPPVIPKQKIQYRAYTSPANVIFNIHAIYENQDFHEYDANALASDYVFRFQQADISSGQPDSLIRAEEVTFAENLFSKGTVTQPAAAKITLQIDTLASSPDLRLGHEGWIRVDLQTSLVVTFPEGNTLNVNSPAVFYFKQEPAGSGTWKFAEWKDEPSTAAPVIAFTRRE